MVQRTHRHDGPDKRHPANRLGLNYCQPPAPRAPEMRILDVHSHVHLSRSAAAFFEAAALYGPERIISMSPMEDARALQAEHGDRIGFIAVPQWRGFEESHSFRQSWLADLVAFWELGARVMKFWVAPPMRAQFGLTLDHEFFEPVIRRALELGYDFMVHVGDPDEWFLPGGRYDDPRRFGTKADQYPQLEWFLERVAPRFVIAAHMGGRIEDPEFLNDLLARHSNLYLDTSATKWIVRGVAARPAAVRDVFLAHPDRLLFGSDLVVADQYDFQHYASRYWAQRTMWETAYDGESPIEDPDAPAAPRLRGIDLPTQVLRKLYWENAAKLGFAQEAGALTTGAARR